MMAAPDPIDPIDAAILTSLHGVDRPRHITPRSRGRRRASGSRLRVAYVVGATQGRRAAR